MIKKEKVSIVSCSSYKNSEVRKALLNTFKTLGFCLPEKKTILIKPNLLSPQTPSKAITTHPSIIEELCKLLRQKGNKIIIGDSSAHNTDLALKKTGMLKLKKYAYVVNFEGLEKKLVEISNTKIKQVRIPKIVFDADMVINIAKLKTHSLTRMTCCVKNLYGLISGSTKEQFHKIIPDPARFSEFLVDIHERVQPKIKLNIIDGIVGLEGEGPSSAGKPKQTGLLIAGTNAIAADIVAADIIGYKKNEVWTNRFGMSRIRLKPEQIEKLGNAKDRKVFYQKPKTSVKNLLGILGILGKPKIKFDYEKCIQCHLCERKCPVKAIKLAPYPCWNNKKCIRCLCCIEVCPKDAISLEKSLPRKIFDYIINKIRRI